MLGAGIPNAVTSSTANTEGNAISSPPQRYLIIKIYGTSQKIPCYN